MKKQIYTSLFLAVALLAGCSKSTPEPEPAEQVIGSYKVDKYTESIKYATAATELSQATIYPVAGKTSTGIGYEVTATLDVAKTASNMVNITFAEKVKYSNGKTDASNSTFTSIELKKIEGSAGQFEMLDTGVKIGTIGNKSILVEEASSDKDSLGRAFTYTIRLTGTKAQ